MLLCLLLCFCFVSLCDRSWTRTNYLTFLLTFATDDITLQYEVYFYSMFYVVISPSHDLLHNTPSVPALSPIARVFNVRGDLFQLLLIFYLTVIQVPPDSTLQGDDTISSTVVIYYTTDRYHNHRHLLE